MVFVGDCQFLVTGDHVGNAVADAAGEPVEWGDDGYPLSLLPWALGIYVPNEDVVVRLLMLCRWRMMGVALAAADGKRPLVPNLTKCPRFEALIVVLTLRV